MRVILIPLAAFLLAFPSQNAVASEAGVYQNPILGDETEESETEKDDNQSVGDEEPECE